MSERKIILLVVVVSLYSLYSVHTWFTNEDTVEDIGINKENVVIDNVPDKLPDAFKENKTRVINKSGKKKLRIVPHNSCDILDVFIRKPKLNDRKEMIGDECSEGPTITVIGIVVFLVALAINAVLDVIKVKEEERARRKENPEGYRRQSLSEFANKKPIRRDSSKFGLHLFQISEDSTSTPVVEKEKKTTRRQARPYARGDSTNSYLSERERKNKEDIGVPYCTASETPTAEHKLCKRQSVAKLIGARPVPMVRRSSFPVLPLNPEVQAMMLGHHSASTDSDDEADGKGRRVRLIRRY